MKYTFRGYAIAVSGLEALDVDLCKILDAPLSKLRGFAFEECGTAADATRMPTLPSRFPNNYSIYAPNDEPPP